MRDTDPHTASADFALHSAWVRRLARRLLDDDALADDLTQEAWLVLRRQPAGTVGNVRAWLGGVVRRIARRTHEREGARRDAARHAAARGEIAEPLAPSTAQVLEAEAIRRTVVDAVLSLEEPYRSTLLLHFYEELSPSEIARRLDIPAPTVRTRLQRGLARVRAKLGERDPRGDLGMRASLSILADGILPNATPLGKGLLVASTTSKAAFVGLALVVLGAGIWWVASDPAKPPAPLETAQFAPAPADDASRARSPGAELESVHDERDRVGIAAPKQPADDRWHLAMRRSVGAIRGTVVGKDDGLPVSGVEVRVATSTGYVARRASLADDREPLALSATTTADGRFAFEGLPTGAYRLQAVGPNGTSADEQATATDTDVRYLMKLVSTAYRSDRVRTLTARATDEEGRPIAGATVELAHREGGGRELRQRLATDANGLAKFDALDLRVGILVATTPDGRVAREHIQAGSSAHHAWNQARRLDESAGFVADMVLRTPGSIAGVVSRGAGSTVRVWLRGQSFFGGGFPASDAATCDDAGSFAIRGLSPGTYLFTVEAPIGSRATIPFLRHPLKVPVSEMFPTLLEVVAGDTTTVRTELTRSSIVEGLVVHGESGDPIANAVVRAWIVHPNNPDAGGTRRGDVYLWHLAWDAGFDEWGPTERFETRTDAHGRYRLSGLAPGEPWVLEVQSAGFERACVDPLRIVDGETLALEHRLARAGGIQGIAWAYAVIGIFRDERCIEAVSVPASSRSAFTVTGLRPGRYELRALHWSDAGRAVPLTSLDVRAGELTTVDLRECAPHVATGRLLHGGAPVEGATIELRDPADQRLQASTDADGRFTFRLAFTSSLSATLDVLAPNVASATSTTFEVVDFLTGDGRVHVLELPDGEVVVDVLDADGRPLRAIVVLEIARGQQRLEKQLARFLDSAARNRGEVIAPKPTDPELPTATTSATGTTRRVTDGSGRARFTALPPGRMQISAETEQGWFLPPVIVDVALGSEARVELRAPETGSVRAHVVDAAGRPLGGVLVNIVLTNDGHEFALTKPRFTDEQGDVVFPFVAAGQARASALTQQPDFMSRRGATVDFDVAASVETRVTITIP